jgi:hypothetical protein
MSCRDIRQAMLEADPAELTQAQNSPLARHLLDCSRCREAASAILEAEHALAAELQRLVPEPDLDFVIREGSAAGVEGIGPLGKGRLSAIRKTTLLPLALAAGLAALLLLREPSLPGAPFTPPDRSAAFEVEPSPDQNVMVLATKDPTITVVWLF